MGSCCYGRVSFSHVSSKPLTCVCFSFQRLLSNEEEKNKEIIQEVCFMVSFYHLQTLGREILFCFIPVNHDRHFGQVKHQHITA